MFTFNRFWLQENSPVAIHISSQPLSSLSRFLLSVSCFIIWQYISSRNMSWMVKHMNFYNFILQNRVPQQYFHWPGWSRLVFGRCSVSNLTRIPATLKGIFHGLFSSFPPGKCWDSTSIRSWYFLQIYGSPIILPPKDIQPAILKASLNKL